jgi:hypothetical protein
METEIKATFILDSEKKHSRRYETKDDQFPITTIYVRRDYADGKDQLEVTLKSA